MKRVQKSQNQQHLQQSQQQTSKGSMLARINNRIRSQNSNKSGMSGQDDPNFSEANSSMRIAGMGGVVAGQGLQGSNNLGIGIGSTHEVNGLDISHISRISAQSSMVTITNYNNQSNTERIYIQPNKQKEVQQQQSSTASMATISHLLYSSKKENIDQQLQNTQLIQDEYMSLGGSKDQQIVSNTQKQQEQKLIINNQNEVANKRMTFQPVIIPTTKNFTPTDKNTTTTDKQPIKKQNTLQKFQSQGDPTKQNQKDINFTNYVKNINNAQSGRPTSGQSMISERTQKSTAGNLRKNMLPPTNNNSKQQPPKQQQLQSSKQTGNSTNKALLNNTQQQPSRNMQQIKDSRYQTTGYSDKFENGNKQIIHNLNEQIRTDSQQNQISPSEDFKSLSVIIKPSSINDKRSSLMIHDLNETNQSSSSNLMKTTSPPQQQKKLKLVVVQSEQHQSNISKSTPDKDSNKNININGIHQNYTGLPNNNSRNSNIHKFTPTSIKQTQNSSITNSQAQITQQAKIQQSNKLQSQKSMINGVNNQNSNKKVVFGKRQARNSSLDSLEDDSQSQNDKRTSQFGQPSKTNSQEVKNTNQNSNRNEEIKQQNVKDSIGKNQNESKQNLITITTQSNQSATNTQDTDQSENQKNQIQQQDKKSIQKIKQVVVLPPTLNKNDKSISDKFNQTQKVIQVKKAIDNKQDKRKSLNIDIQSNVLQKFQSTQQPQQQVQTNLNQQSPIKKQKTGVFGTRTQRSLSSDSLEDKSNKNQKSNNKNSKQFSQGQMTKTQEIINTQQQLNINQNLKEEVKSADKKQRILQQNNNNNDSKSNSSISKLNKIPSQSSIISFLNLEKEAQQSMLITSSSKQVSNNSNNTANQVSTLPSSKQLVLIKGDSRVSDKSTLLNADSKKNVSSHEKMQLITPNSKQSSLNLSQQLNQFKSSSQVVQLTNMASKMITPRDQKFSSNMNTTNDTQCTSQGTQKQQQQQQSQQKNLQILLGAQQNNQQQVNNKQVVTEQKIESNNNKLNINTTQLKSPILERNKSSNQQEQQTAEFQQQKPQQQQQQQQQNLNVLAQKQLMINGDNEMREYNKLKNEINQFLKRNNILQYTDQAFTPDYTIEYESFRNLLKHLCFLDPNKANPIQDYFIGQMWVKELMAAQYANIKNVVNLLSGILKIQVNEIIVPQDELNLYQQNMSIMLFTKEGQAKFKSREDVEQCANTYSMLSRQREELIVQKKYQESEEKRKVKNGQSIRDQLNRVSDNIKIEVGSFDNNKGPQNALGVSHISPRSVSSANSLQFSDLEKNSQRSRVVMLPNKRSEEEIKLEIMNSNLRNNSSNQKDSPLLNFNKNDSMTTRDVPSNEQKGFKSHTPSARSTFQSSNLLNVVNNKINLRDKSKFGKILEEDTPKLIDSTPRNINKRDSNINNDILSRSTVQQHSSQDNIRQSMNFPANVRRLNNGKIAFTQGLNSMKGRKKIILDLTSPDQYLNQLEQLPINPKFDSKSKMPVEEDSDQNKFGKLSDGSKLSEMIRSVGARVSDDSDRNRRPLLFMDVNLGQQKGIQKLIVYENDSPSYLAKKFGELHQLREKAVQQLADLITKKIDEALEARKHVKPRSRSPEIKSREPSPTDMTLRVVKKTQGVKVKSNTHGEVKIKREEDDEDEW